MSEQEITPEYVIALKRRITDGEWYANGNDVYVDFGDKRFLIAENISQQWDGDPDNSVFIAAAPAIADAYLDKCEEADKFRNENEKFFKIAAAYTLANTENARLRSIIEQQRVALQRIYDLTTKGRQYDDKDAVIYKVSLKAVEALAAAQKENDHAG